MDTITPRLSALPFPTLSVLAIYSAATLPQARSSGSGVDVDVVADEAGDDEEEKGDEQMIEMNKVLFWYSQQTELSAERKGRLMGTIRGMADFAR